MIGDANDPWRVLVCVALALFAAHLSNLHPDDDEEAIVRGYNHPGGDDPLAGHCTIPVEVDLPCDRFVREYMGLSPVVLRPSTSHPLWANNQLFIDMSARDEMERDHGDLRVKMSTANSYTGRDWTDMAVRDYLRTHLHDAHSSQMGNETYYLFGSTHGPDWEAFLAQYHPPTQHYPSEAFFPSKPPSCDADALAQATSTHTALSFGIAGRGSGVPFHFHGPGFLQQLHGRKRWFLYPPHAAVKFHPDESTLHWVESVYPTMAAPPTHECVLEPGDVIYFPSQWMHATLNLSPYTVFMATFA
ncbi:Aste57867_20532 [Aphanomyces stellatus]|uniref:Aste57867_20532 protein n=1 Tax=Aphanomyces stellatus TaxID=120398 RepID=A0A485LGD5_9STRA|nr:hypothetical protein As57867_020465 [Aphanomyces stellatus]VFT97217.1 Aste57867_20532 [Aphanomyces stellatus]